MLTFSNNEVRTDSGELWGTYRKLNPVAGDPIPESVPGKLVVHTGTPADDLFEQHPLSWGEAAQGACREWCTRAAAAGHELALRTHARHVLCDTPRCNTFAEWIAEQNLPIQIILEPESLLEPGMEADLEDHIERMFRLAGRSIDAVLIGADEPQADLDLDELARYCVESATRWEYTGLWIAGKHLSQALAPLLANS